MTDDPLYRSVKTRILNLGFPQDQRITLTAIAAEYDASEWALRRVLTCLAKEGLVRRAGAGRYIVPALDIDDIEGQYLVSRHVLGIALELLRRDSSLTTSSKDSANRLLALVEQCSRDDHDALADYTAMLFATIARFTNTPPIVNAVARSNHDLKFLRLVECRVMSDVQGDLERLCSLLVDESWDELIVAVDEYHRQRTQLLPTLIESVSG